MKKILYPIAAMALFFATSCVNDAEDYNNDRDKPYIVPAESLLANAQKQLADQQSTPSVNLNPLRYFTQYWTAVQYPQESQFNLVTRNVSHNYWTALYRDVLGNLEGARIAVSNEVKPDVINEADWAIIQSNKYAIIEILKVYTFQVLVDTFGDVPYSEALNTAIILPKYDDDAEIYPDLINRVNLALADLDDSQGSFNTGDIINGGDIDNWKLFANSLKVKLGINLADVNATLAQSTVESAVTAGVILTNDNNSKFNYSGAAPFYSAIYAALVASGRNDYVGSETVINVLTTLNDNRLEQYFLPNSAGNYVGGLNGTTNAYTLFSPIGDILRDPSYPAYFFDASEMNFYLAEAAARGYTVGGSAESYYNAGIETSFQFWGLTTADATAYLANPDVAYATAGTDWKAKIGKQAWLALFNRPVESWSSYRRLDVPTLVAPPTAVPAADGQIPKRLTYPINEQTVNRVNLEAASSAIGGDKLQTRIFWDIN